MSRLSVHTFGDDHKPAILMLHGFMGSGQDWQTIAQLLEARFFVVAPDLPRHGSSHFAHAKRFPTDITAHMVIDVLDSYQIKQCVGVGYSMGGRLLLYLATHYPERFEQIILESAFPGLRTQAERTKRRCWDLQMAKRLRSLNFEVFLQQWYAMPLFETFQQHPKFDEAVAQRLKNDPQQLALSMEEMGTGMMEPLWEKWERLEIDSLLLVGEYDVKYCRLAREMAKLNKQAKVIVLQNAGHNVHFEQPTIFASQISHT